MELRGFLVRVTDGTVFRHTVVLAADAVLARSKATALFQATRWRVADVRDIAR